MKKSRTMPITAIFILSLCIGCKDIGDKYIGNWDFVIDRSVYQGFAYEKVEVERDTLHYSGKITSGNYENQVIIQYTENDAISAMIWKEEGDFIIYTNSLASMGGNIPVALSPKKMKSD